MKQKARILTYHRIGRPRKGRFERLTVPPHRFRRQIRSLKALGYRFITMDEVAAWLDGKGPAPSRGAVVSFDDGYRELYAHAFPLLRAEAIPSVVYIVADRDRDVWVDWNQKENLELLGWSEVEEMAEAGVAVGSHTLTHPRLTRLSDEALAEEVEGSKKRIEDRLGREVCHFCYPFGDVDRRVEEAVRRAGYTTACTTQKGAVGPGTNPFRLPRLTVGKRMGLVRFWRRLLFSR